MTGENIVDANEPDGDMSEFGIVVGGAGTIAGIVLTIFFPPVGIGILIPSVIGLLAGGSMKGYDFWHARKQRKKEAAEQKLALKLAAKGSTGDIHGRMDLRVLQPDGLQESGVAINGGHQAAVQSRYKDDDVFVLRESLRDPCDSAILKRRAAASQKPQEQAISSRIR